MANAALPRPVIIPSVVYHDSRAALEWLQKAFGFEIAGVFTDAAGKIVHAEMSFGEGVVMIGDDTWFDWTRSPASIGGTNTQRIHVQLESGIDEHYERARAAGAKIIGAPSDQFYGDRTYAAYDLEGHAWTFAQPVRQVSFEEMEKDTGFKYKQSL